VAPAAMAQTTNPVVLYGVVYETLESVEGKGPTTAATAPRRQRVSDQASRLGVRGTEDLGGGLKAFFQLETVFKADQNDSTFANRNSAVGLQGGFGSILMGRWDTPLKVAANAMDPFGDVTLGGQSVATLGSGVGGVQGQFDLRQQNVVQYWSPSWAGVAVRLSYAANEARSTSPCAGQPAGSGGCNPRSEGASITYTGGPIYIGYAYHEFKDGGGVGVTNFAVIPEKQSINAIFGSFTFGPIKVGGLYDKVKRTSSLAAADYSDQKAWLANVVWTLGNNQIIYQHQDAKDGALKIATTGQPSCKADSIAWQYNFSRRTFFLAQYSKVDNNDLGTCNYGSTPGPLTTNVAGQDLRGIGLGIRHSF
jgi:predicted porin